MAKRGRLFQKWVIASMAALLIAVTGVPSTGLQPAEAKAATAASVTVNTSKVIQENFDGFGFNVSPDNPGSEQEWESVVGKRIQELGYGGYYRILGLPIGAYAPEDGVRNFDSPAMQQFVNYMKLFKANGIKVYITMAYKSNPAYLGGGNIITDPVIQDKWAQAAFDGIRYLVEDQGLDNIVEWSIGNEAETNEGWGYFYYGGEIPQNSYEALLTKFRQKLETSSIADAGIQILAPDAGGMYNFDMISNWYDLPALTDIYGEHYYVSGGEWKLGDGATRMPGVTEANWSDPSQYGRYTQVFNYHTNFIKSRFGKETGAGEFGTLGGGGLQDQYYVGGETGIFGTAMSEVAVGLLNAGYKRAAKWNLFDLGFFQQTSWYKYRFGTMGSKWENWRIRPDYYAYGLMARYIRGNSSVYEVTSSDPMVRAAAVKHKGDQSDTLVVINRNASNTQIEYRYTGHAPAKALRKFVYDPFHVPTNTTGDLQPYSELITVTDGTFTDTVGPDQVVVYTTEYDETAPGAVGGLQYANKKLTWSASPEEDFAYYRIYKDGVQIASTIAAHYRVTGAGSQYAVSAVDRYGNEGPKAVIAGDSDLSIPEPLVIEAENFSDQSGVSVSETGTIGSIENGDWVRYGSVNLGNGYTSIAAKLAVPIALSGHEIEVRLDSPSGTLIGTIKTIGSTHGEAGWSTFSDSAVPLSGASGVHDIYLVASGGQQSLGNIDSIRFSHDAVTPYPVPPKVSRYVPDGSLDRSNWNVRFLANHASMAETIDTDDASIFYSGRNMLAGDGFTIDLGAQMTFNRMVGVVNPDDFWRGYRLSVSNDGSSWQDVTGELKGYRNSVMLTDLTAPQTARYVKVELTEGAPVSWFSLREIFLANSDKPYVNPDPGYEPPPAAQVKNPGFEEGTTAWFLGTGFSISDTENHTDGGSKSLHAAGARTWHSASQDVAIEKQTDYRFSFYAKPANPDPNNGEGAYYRLGGLNDQELCSGFTQIRTEGWTEYACTFNSGESTVASIYVKDYVGAQYFDDFNLTKLTIVRKPNNLKSLWQTVNEAKLQWDAVSGAAGYDIYRNGTKINAEAVTGTNYTDSGLSPDTAYTYTVRARSAGGNESADSNAVMVRTWAGNETNMIRNGTFEQDFNGWNRWGGTENIAGTGGHSGSKGVNMGEHWGGGDQSIKYNVSPNTTYTLSAWGKASAPSEEVNVVVAELYDARNNKLGDHYVWFQDNTEPEFRSVTFTTPADIDRIAVYFYKSEGTVQFNVDEISLTKEAPDTEPPAAPVLQVESSTTNSVTLAWEAVADNSGQAPEYRLYRNNELLALEPELTGSTYRVTVSGLAPSTDYLFKLEAVDGAGNVAENRLTVTLGDTQAPSAPSDFKGEAAKTSVTLTWTAAEDNMAVTGYLIYRNGEQVRTLGGSERSVMLTELQKDTVYTFGIQAVDAAGNKSELASVEVKTDHDNRRKKKE